MNYRVAEYSEYKDLRGKGDWDSGILKVHLSSWNEFHDVTSRLLKLGDFIWRGQEKDWPLISRFDRMVNTDRETKLRNHRESFVRAIQGRRGNNPPKLDKPEEYGRLVGTMDLQHHYWTGPNLLLLLPILRFIKLWGRQYDSFTD